MMAVSCGMAIFFYNFMESVLDMIDKMMYAFM